MWHLNLAKISYCVAVVSDGHVRAAVLDNESSKCTLQIKDLAGQDPGLHHCQKRPEVLLPRSGEKSEGAQVLSPDIKRKIYDLNGFLSFSPFRDPRVDRQAWHNAVAAVSLSYVSEENTLCGCSGGSLTWLDEAGAEVQEDLHHRIKQESPCDITFLTYHFSNSWKEEAQVSGHRGGAGPNFSGAVGQSSRCV